LAFLALPIYSFSPGVRILKRVGSAVIKGASTEISFMPLENILTGCRLPPGGNAYETNDAAVRAPLDHGELAEILVEGYKNSPFRIRHR
jgi:hypothetical protein